MAKDLPWQPRSRQMQGRRTEQVLARQRGARTHPNSGAGRIKDDASTEDTVIEYKDAKKTHTLKADDLDALFRRATKQGKDAEYVIYFGDHQLLATITFERKRI